MIYRIEGTAFICLPSLNLHLCPLAFRDHRIESGLMVLWLASLQVPYLLSLATILCSYLPAFSFAPDPTFRMIRKLDMAFSSLLRGPPLSPSTVDSRQNLVSLTDQVRIRSVTELTRVSVVDMLSSRHQPTAQKDESEVDYTTSDEPDSITGKKAEISSHLLQLASQVYLNTLDLLGDSLISDDRARD